MIDYQFYTQVYLGSDIPQKAFDAMALRAKEWLGRLETSFRVVSTGEESRSFAICAIAETLYAHRQRHTGITAASVGEVSVQYEDSGAARQALQRELYEKASIYLDIYRGVGQ